MHSTRLRREHIHGVLLGTAIGEALGYARSGLTRRQALKGFGRPPLRYCFCPGRGIYGEQTRLTLLNAQALLNSRSDLRVFRRAFCGRLSWYALSLPLDGSRCTWASAIRSWLSRFSVSTGRKGQGSQAAARAVLSALAINGTGHRLVKWIEESTKLTHVDPVVINGCVALATLADCCVAKGDELDTGAALQQTIDVCSTSELANRLKELKDFLDQRRSPTAVARHFGWEDGISGDIVPSTVMATYCFLRYPKSFRRAVETAITLGGKSASLGAIVGALSGAHVGEASIPELLQVRLAGSPHGPEWIEKMAERFSHWPHGVDDLHLAPAQSSDPLMQIIRNLMGLPLLAFLVVRRGVVPSAKHRRRS